MLPAQGASGPLVSISRNGVQVSYRTETIKGVMYAFFDGLSGGYQASYVPDTTPPVISDIAVVSPEGNAVITWNTDEFATSRVDYGINPAALTLSAIQPALVTAHTMTLTGLTPNTTYYYRVTSVDSTGNPAPVVSISSEIP